MTAAGHVPGGCGLGGGGGLGGGPLLAHLYAVMAGLPVRSESWAEVTPAAWQRQLAAGWGAMRWQMLASAYWCAQPNRGWCGGGDEPELRACNRSAAAAAVS